MPRIRTIKPEFPQSESMGRVSREARLLFVLLWTICDDEGRTRASSRMLASLLYPYDDDARTLIEGWLEQLEVEGCIRRYRVDDTTYLDIPKWLTHQKIDHASKSRLPPFREDSRVFEKDSETLAPDLGPRTKDLGPRKDSVPTVQRAPPALVVEDGENTTDAPLTPSELRREAWRSHIAYLARCNIPEARARSLIGAWCKKSDQGTVIQLIGQAEVSAVVDPVPYIEAALKKRNGNGHAKNGNGNGHHSPNVAVGTVAWFHQQNNAGIFNDEERLSWAKKLGVQL